MFKKFRSTLAKTRNQVVGQLATTLGASDITEETWEELEETLVLGDFGVETTIELVDRTRERAENEGLIKADQLIPALKKEMRLMLTEPPEFQIGPQRQLTMAMIVGVNGSGKTTSIGKLAKYYKNDGFKVRMAAGDTFRAAAIDQLKVWADRADVPITAGQPGSDSAATIYDSIRASRARDIGKIGEKALLLVDTAGRLHTQFNLMRELEKIHDVCQKSVHGAPHEVLIVVDAPTGQNAIIQAEKFKEAVNVTGVILTKLDGTAKGGMVFSIYRELNLPIRFMGTGEGIDDIAPFDPDAFIDAMFDEE